MRETDYAVPYNLQFFAEEAGGTDGEGVSDMQALENLLAQADNPDATVTQPAQATPPATEQVQEPDKQEPPKQNTEAHNKQEYAFAQMRTQNSQLINLLSKIAQATGIEAADDKDLISKLNDDTISKLAAKQGMPPEMLKRLELLEERDKQYQQEQLKNAAFIGFQKVKNTFGLTDEELRAFADDLDKNNKNPFFTAVNLEAEYKMLHFDEIQQKKIDAAVAAALAKSDAANTHSTTPNNAQGRTDSGNTERITTVAGLDEFLKNA